MHVPSVAIRHVFSAACLVAGTVVQQLTDGLCGIRGFRGPRRGVRMHYIHSREVVRQVAERSHFVQVPLDLQDQWAAAHWLWQPHTTSA